MKKLIYVLMLGSLMLLGVPGKAGPPGLDQRTYTQFIVNANGGFQAVQVIDKMVIESTQWNLTCVEVMGADLSFRPPTVSAGYSKYKDELPTEVVKIPVCHVLRC